MRQLTLVVQLLLARVADAFMTSPIRPSPHLPDAFMTSPIRPSPHLRSTYVCLQEADAVPLETYGDAEARGFQFYKDGEWERAIRMFELAQTLPGDGVDLKRAKQGGMVGSATAPPNPREWVENRFATPEQKLIAQYNIACCFAAMGDKPRAIEILRTYAAQVGEPLNQVNEMLVDSDLVSIREELRALRDEYKTADSKPGLFGLPGIRNPLRGIADSVGVEWKD